MMGNLAKAIGQLNDPRVRNVILGSLVATLVLFFVVGVLVVVGLGFIQLTGFAVFDWVIQALGGAGVVVLAWFAFPAFMGVIASLFLDQIVDAVEARHYPGLPPAAGPGTLASAWLATKFAGVVVAVNLVALPFYLIFLFFPILSFVLFLMINGYLLGREYFELVAMRRLDDRSARTLRRSNRTGVFSAGLVVALLTTIPFVNLIAPVLATAFVTHVFHGFRSAAPAHA